MSLILGFVMAAVTIAGPPVSPPASVPAGASACVGCHDGVAAQFDRSAHGGVGQGNVQAGRCEACHGAGTKHIEAGGGATGILSFTKATTAEAAQACLTCHRKGHAMQWAGSEHALGGVSCVDCHKIHQSRQVLGAVTRADGLVVSHAAAPAARGSLAKPETELCLSCHRDVRTKMFAQSHHPVREGRMTCSSCHDVHGTGLAGVKTTQRVNDLCTKCHPKHQGPFVFEHAPVEESCMTCHDPHGTVANNMLKQNEPFLCLQCHEMHFHAARVAQTTPYYLPSGGSDNRNGITGFMQSFNTRCTNCHNKIHGSDLPSQGVSGRGKALIR